MAHTEELLVNGAMTPVRVFDLTAQAIDDAAAGFPAVKQTTETLEKEMPEKAPLESPAFTGTPTLNGAPFGTGSGGGIGRNLLDNWYFANPVDQRGGYVVPVGTNVYVDAALSNFVGQSAFVYPVVEITSSYVKVLNEGGTHFYAEKNSAVRGYTGAGYGIDRWRSWESDTTTTIHDGHITTTRQHTQMIEQSIIEIMRNRAVTMSLLLADGTLHTATKVYSYTDDTIGEVGPKIYIDGGYDEGGTDVVIWCQVAHSFQVNTATSCSVVAAKLELGTEQTLAHQENGKWVLNEIPDYGEELRKCQRYQLVTGDGTHYWSIGNGQARRANTISLIVPTPVTLRGVPTAYIEGVLRLRQGDTYTSVVDCSVDAPGSGSVMVIFPVSGASAGMAYEAFIEPGNKFILDANL